MPEFNLARDMLNRKLILQTGISDSNSAKCAYEQALNGDKNKLLIVYDIYMSLPNYIRTDIDVFNAVHLLMGYDIDIHNIHQIEGQSYVGDTGLVEFHIDEQSKIQTILDLYYEEVDKNQIK